MSLPRSLTTVTKTSKAVAAVLFVILVIGAFAFGMWYQSQITLIK